MKSLFSNITFLRSAIGVLIAVLVYFISLIRSYEPEMHRLKLENMKQDSIIAFQELDIVRLNKKINYEFDNIYDVFHTQHVQIRNIDTIVTKALR